MGARLVANVRQFIEGMKRAAEAAEEDGESDG